MVFGSDGIVEKGIQAFQLQWETSRPTWVGPDEPARFCGLEVRRMDNGVFFEYQYSYIKEVLKRHKLKDVASTLVMKKSKSKKLSSWQENSSGWHRRLGQSWQNLFGYQ